ncbi:MAG: hypothetical protein MJ014_02440 [Methanocorpusculum sp.]|nr:hypothetical protein [Methanocorpusculum sp.]
MTTVYRMPSSLLLIGTVVLCFLLPDLVSLVTVMGSWFMTELIKPEWHR